MMKDNRDIYGVMNNTFAVNTEMLCPAGWHVRTDAEWTILTDFIGAEGEAGSKMKANGTAHWNSPNTGATNAAVSQVCWLVIGAAMGLSTILAITATGGALPYWTTSTP